MSYYTSYLEHHGILGQKWGKKNGPPYLLDASDHSASEKKAGWKKSLDKMTNNKDTKKKVAKSVNGMKMNLQLFAHKSSSRKTVKLKATEYAHVMSELRTNITKEEKTHTIINKAIGNYTYSFENHFDDTYRIIGKRKIPQSTTGILKRIMDED